MPSSSSLPSSLGFILPLQVLRADGCVGVGNMVSAGGAPSYPNMIGGFTRTQPAIIEERYRGRNETLGVDFLRLYCQGTERRDIDASYETEHEQKTRTVDSQAECNQVESSRVESTQVREGVLSHLLMGSMVRSLDTKSLPAELIFFHTDLQRAQRTGKGTGEPRDE